MPIGPYPAQRVNNLTFFCSALLKLQLKTAVTIDHVGMDACVKQINAARDRMVGSNNSTVAVIPEFA